MLSDSSKLFVRNGGLVWRILPYLLISLLVVVGLALAICYPLIDKLIQVGFFTQLSEILNQMFFNYRVDELFVSLSELNAFLFQLISDNIATVLPLVIILIIVISLGSSLLVGLNELAIADCLYGYMSSNSKLSFSSCFIKNLGKSFKLQLSKLLVVWPLDLLIVAVFVGMLFLFTLNNPIISVITPFLIVLALCVLLALRQTLFCMWSPCMIVRNRTVFGALRESFVCMAHNFGTIYGRQFVVVVFYIAINLSVCIFTASVGLLLTVPATLIFSNILGQTCFFYINGLRFYVGDNQIVSPKKREDWERVKTIKDII